jgi:hypothetical protein
LGRPWRAEDGERKTESGRLQRERKTQWPQSADCCFIADGNDSTQWCALEMDDAALGALFDAHHLNYASVRNTSEPNVPSTTRNKRAIAASHRQARSSLNYEHYGLTRYNGALITWMLVAATPHH